MRYSPLLTDLYELTMLAGYLDEGLESQPAVFDLFFRTNPFQGGYGVFAGLAPALAYLEQLSFNEDELAYLASLNLFKPRFIDFLRQFRFTGVVEAPPEGTVVFAHEPLLTLSGPLAQVQFVEAALLNIINFHTLVATKAARIKHAAAGGTVLEFGLRRAHGPDGALSASRAAAVGGVISTSNVLAGKEFGLSLRGTHAHSWVMTFPTELSAFRAYATAFPDNCVLLVDTYDTLKSGVPNALVVAQELRAAGHELAGIRIDSGDLAYLSRQARYMLNDAGFPDVKIVASNDLDEYVIDSIREEGGAIDIYGVGTRLVTCAGPGGGALGGVYKLVEIDGSPRLKVTGEVAKATLPGKKRLIRIVDDQGGAIQDVVFLEGETIHGGERVYDPVNPLQFTELPTHIRWEELRSVVMEQGQRTAVRQESLEEMGERSSRQLACLPQGCLRLMNPHRYKVSVSSALNELRSTLIEEAHTEHVNEVQ